MPSQPLVCTWLVPPTVTTSGCCHMPHTNRVRWVGSPPTPCCTAVMFPACCCIAGAWTPTPKLPSQGACRKHAQCSPRQVRQQAAGEPSNRGHPPVGGNKILPPTAFPPPSPQQAQRTGGGTTAGDRRPRNCDARGGRHGRMVLRGPAAAVCQGGHTNSRPLGGTIPRPELPAAPR